MLSHGNSTRLSNDKIALTQKRQEKKFTENVSLYHNVYYTNAKSCS